MAGYGACSLLIAALLLLVYAPIPLDPPVGSASGSGDPVITIEGDDEFTSENGVSSGSGTQNDPYIIEDKNITMVSNGTINIKDTDKFVTIRNCSLHSDRDDGDAIVNLFSASNVSIVNCTIDGYRLGVRMDKCDRITIIDVSFENGLLSIYVFLSSNVAIENVIDIPDKNDRSVFSIRSDHLSVRKCSFNGSIDLDNSIHTSIADTTFKQGLSIWGEMTGIYIDNVTLDGKEILFVKDEDDVSILGDYGAIFLVNVTDSTFFDQNISVRIFCSNCDNFTFDNCTLMTTLMMWDCSNLSFKNNTLLWTYIYLTRININTIMGSNLTDSRIFNTECANISVENNTFSMNSMIYFTECQNILYSKNDNTGVTAALGWVTELSFEDCTNIEYSNNSIGSYKYVWITSCRGMDIKNSIFMFSTRIFISGANNLSFHDSTLSHVNIQLMCNGSVEMFRNYLHNVGFESYGSSNVSVYNNKIDGFITTNNPSEINWSYLIPGFRNIVGGPNIGGNFWVGYSGKDTDFDGFGDEYLPYGPGDNYPLIDLRGNLSLIDLTKGVPITGRDYSITFKAWEPIETMSDLYYSIDYSFYDYNGAEYDGLSAVGYLSKNHEKSYELRIKDEAVRMDYRITVSDRYGRVSTVNGPVQVSDGMSPQISMLGMSNLNTGERAWCRFGVMENICIRSFNISMMVDDEKNLIELKELSKDDGNYVVNFTLDPKAARIMFIFNVTDVNGLTIVKEYGWYKVVDTIEPAVHFITYKTAQRGEDYELFFQIHENTDVEYLAVYLLVDDLRKLVPFTYVSTQEGWAYHSTVRIFEYQTATSFLVQVRDSAHNSVDAVYELHLISNEWPFYEIAPGAPRTGEIHEIEIDMDPARIEVELIRITFDELPPVDLDYETPVRFPIPSDARTMKLQVEFVDGGGYVHHYETTVDVLDTIIPSIDLDTSDPVCGDQFLIRPEYSDNIAVVSHGIVFDYGTGLIEMDDDENFMTGIDIPIDAFFLNITIWAKDLQGNMAYLNLSLDVKDRTPPAINSVDAEIVYDKIRIIASISDNRDPSDISCHIESNSLEDGPKMDLVQGSFEAWIDPPEGVDYIHFTVVAIDGSGNHAISEVQGIEIPHSDVDDISDDRGDYDAHVKIALVALVVLALGSLLIFLIRKRRSFSEE